MKMEPCGYTLIYLYRDDKRILLQIIRTLMLDTVNPKTLNPKSPKS